MHPSVLSTCICCCPRGVCNPRSTIPPRTCSSLSYPSIPANSLPPPPYLPACRRYPQIFRLQASLPVAPFNFKFLSHKSSARLRCPRASSRLGPVEPSRHIHLETQVLDFLRPYARTLWVHVRVAIGGYQFIADFVTGPGRGDGQW
ncbi:hypothetical protein L226DRAFT_4750 [Lentinus tigrinus ALCF2SS1-7]|uniref:uncharacterized protein n=1 Tax=Lentinus tigrinus ALCF2SS1-7 TaxID=1328758 RepID=UPI00116629DE|nr:hypothetical protein L226DRAFT_4750 [Lentinus tigrinus ALCF2SS1-7]